MPTVQRSQPARRTTVRTWASPIGCTHADICDCRRGPHGAPAPASTMVEVLMQTMLYLDIEPTVLAELLRALSVQGEVLAIRAGQEALSIGAASGMSDEATIRAYLTARGL